MREEPEFRLLRGNDAENALINIYLNGMLTGAATAARTFAAGAPREDCDKFAWRMIALIRADPLAVESVRREIAETLKGVDSGPYDLPIGDWGKS